MRLGRLVFAIVHPFDYQGLIAAGNQTGIVIFHYSVCSRIWPLTENGSLLSAANTQLHRHDSSEYVGHRLMRLMASTSTPGVVCIQLLKLQMIVLHHYNSFYGQVELWRR